jgi:uncharacterized phage protein (TIGR01671 family)
MRKYLFRGQRIDNKEWAYGAYLPITQTICTEKTYPDSTEYMDLFVIPETVGQYTEMNEFVMADKSINQPLFEGDIVEIHSVRCPYAAYPQSKYDGPVKARAVIYFERGMWRLDYKNKYNEKMCEPRGNEQYERSVNNSWELYYFGYHGKNEDKYREQNKRCHYHDIVKLGNIYDNPELLEV